MRTREKSYYDYGITNDEVKYIKEFCRNADKGQQNLIRYALSDIQPYIAPYIFYSLINNISYDKICAKNYICICKDDFYAYRRKAIASIKESLIKNKIWHQE